jgi:8-oxo-dGTP pyrophosphatase MutT (NUDIX family)
MECSLDALEEKEISQRLSAALLEPQNGPIMEFSALPDFVQEEPRKAAVLIPLICKDGAWNVLLTRRSAQLPEHSGQVAFPGGRSDPRDPSPEATALREAFEEIGLVPDDVRLLGRLREYITVTNYLVTPVVGAIPWPYPLSMAKDEVSRVFSIPLSWLANPDNYEIRLRELPEPYAPVPVVYFKQYEGELLWGASARFALALLNALQMQVGKS